jgi:hypothetical protein
MSSGRPRLSCSMIIRARRGNGRRQKRHQLRQEFFDGPRTMAQHPFDQRTQFAEGAMVFDNLEKRVVTETVAAAWCESNPSITTAFCLGPNLAGRISQHSHADVVGLSLLGRNSLKSLQRRALLAASSPCLPAYTAEWTPGSPPSAGTTSPLSLAEHPFAQSFGQLRRFQRSIFLEARPRLVRNRRLRENLPGSEAESANRAVAPAVPALCGNLRVPSTNRVMVSLLMPFTMRSRSGSGKLGRSNLWQKWTNGQSAS